MKNELIVSIYLENTDFSVDRCSERVLFGWLTLGSLHGEADQWAECPLAAWGLTTLEGTATGKALPLCSSGV